MESRAWHGADVRIVRIQTGALHPMVSGKGRSLYNLLHSNLDRISKLGGLSRNDQEAPSWHCRSHHHQKPN